jgi:hypothetical protein
MAVYSLERKYMNERERDVLFIGTYVQEPQGPQKASQKTYTKK